MASSSTALFRRAVISAAALALVATNGGCARPMPAAQTQTQARPGTVAIAAVEKSATEVRTMVDDRTLGAGLGRFRYVGHWEGVAGRSDGRSLGTSTRSFHHADVASLTFIGTRIRLYGVVGQKGGDALVSVDGDRGEQNVSFRGPRIAPHALVYTSPILDPGVHTLTVFVTGQDSVLGHGGFVNIDNAVITDAPDRRD